MSQSPNTLRPPRKSGRKTSNPVIKKWTNDKKRHPIGHKIQRTPKQIHNTTHNKINANYDIPIHNFLPDCQNTKADHPLCGLSYEETGFL